MKLVIALASCVSLALAAACTRDPVAASQAYTQSADAYAANKQFDEAIIEYGRALPLTPDAIDIRIK
jgi:hypothetical protein